MTAPFLWLKDQTQLSYLVVMLKQSLVAFALRCNFFAA